MKTLYKIKSLKKAMTSGLFLMLSFWSTAQVLNNQIHYEVRPYQVYYNGFSDVNSDGEAVYIVKIQDENTGIWYDEVCNEFLVTETPFTYTNTDPDVWYFAGGYGPFDSAIDIDFTGMEDDDSNRCNYNPDEDDDYYSALGIFTVCCNAPVTQNGNRLPSQWYYNDNDNNDGWIFPGSDIWDFRIHTAYRYAYGDNCNEPLQFGQLDANSEYSHINSTSNAIEGTHSGTNPLTYSNTGENTSPDAYYSFTITESYEVTISTVHDATNYDTYIQLYSEDCGTSIALNDDVEPGTDLRSEIVTTIPAGTYKIMVEGFQELNGEFELSISTGNVVTGIEENVELTALKIFPNPTSDIVNISFNNNSINDVEVSLINLVGQTIFQTTSQGQTQLAIPVSDFNAGIYYVILNNGNESIKEKLIIQ